MDPDFVCSTDASSESDQEFSDNEMLPCPMMAIDNVMDENDISSEWSCHSAQKKSETTNNARTKASESSMSAQTKTGDQSCSPEMEVSEVSGIVEAKSSTDSKKEGIAATKLGTGSSAPSMKQSYLLLSCFGNFLPFFVFLKFSSTLSPVLSL